MLTSLNAYVLDHDLDIVDEHDWLSKSHPIMANTVATILEGTDNNVHQPKLTEKAKQRRKKKDLVALKSFRENETKID